MRTPRLLLKAITVSAASLPVAMRAADVESLPDAAAAEPPRCQSDLVAFDEELAQAGFGVLTPGGYVGAYGGYGGLGYGLIGTPRQQMQALRDAAEVYALRGDEEACRAVLASMREIYESHEEPVGLEADDPEARTAWRRAHLAKAVPVTEMARTMRADVVIGADLRTPDDAKLGEIDDIVLDPQRQTIAYVLVARGGFLGLGRELVAVRWSDLRATDDHEIYVLDVTPDAFAAAPRVDRRNFGESFGEAWRSGLDQYWAGAVGKQ